MQRIIGLFKSEPAQPHALTRFEKTPELNAVAILQAKLLKKRDELKVMADRLGAQSVEYQMHSIINHMVNNTQAEISKFNERTVPETNLEKIADIHILICSIKNFIVISDADLVTINSSNTDKHYIRNAAFGLGILALPFAPFLALGAGITAAALCLGGIVMMGPTQKLLININAIATDTETKELIEKFVEVTNQIEANLKKRLEIESGTPQVHSIAKSAAN